MGGERKALPAAITHPNAGASPLAPESSASWGTQVDREGSEDEFRQLASGRFALPDICFFK